jgi:transcriptional regulator with XRE-family HTH domain
MQNSNEKLKNVLKRIQLLTQTRLDQELTHDDLAKRAGVTKRSLGDWMRGVCAPPGMCAIFELLSQLNESDVADVLEYWRSPPSSSDPPRAKKRVSKTEKPGRPRNQPVAATTKKKISR